MVYKKTQYKRDFKVPVWDHHYSHYKEKVNYRVQRRVLEYRHEPFHWEDWDEEEESVRSYHLENCAIFQHHDRGAQTPVWEKKAEQNKNENNSKSKQVPPLPMASLRKDEIPVRPRKPRTKSAKASVRQPAVQERPPFVPYGYMDKERIVGSKRTHNVKANVADPLMIYPAALRARKRQELEIQRQREAATKQRHDLNRQERALSYRRSREEQAWETEYQRNYSAARR